MQARKDVALEPPPGELLNSLSSSIDDPRSVAFFASFLDAHSHAVEFMVDRHRLQRLRFGTMRMTTARRIADAAAAKRRNLKARHGSAGRGFLGRTESRRDGAMAHTYPNVLIHCVFSTKQRRNTIPGELHEKLSMYFVGIGKGHELPVLCAGGTANHSHLLIALPTRVSLAKAVQVLKANSSRWLGDHGLDFAWQDGYGAFSVSSSNVEVVKHYIEHQAEHHAKHSFEDEFVSLLRKSGVSYNPQFMFG